MSWRRHAILSALVGDEPAGRDWRRRGRAGQVCQQARAGRPHDDGWAAAAATAAVAVAAAGASITAAAAPAAAAPTATRPARRHPRFECGPIGPIRAQSARSNGQIRGPRAGRAAAQFAAYPRASGSTCAPTLGCPAPLALAPNSSGSPLARNHIGPF